MSIPDFQSMMFPLLRAINDGMEHHNRSLSEQLSREFQLSDAEYRDVLKSGAKVFDNRLAWAKAHMRRAGLIESPSRGVIRITDAGTAVLRDPPAKLNLRFLKSFPGYDWHQSPSIAGTAQPNGGALPDQTPEEMLDAAYLQIREKVAADILEKVRACSPAFFERLVVRVLVAIGYGSSLQDAGRAVKSRDGGIDGIINEDKLGLDIVCVQAKRWQGSVGRPVVQAFAGSMEGLRARKGVLITTSTFSKDALEYVGHIERRIVLVDGERLAELMIDHDVGVSTIETYVVKRVDSDFFVEDE